jgi:hypothetical protein
MNCHEFIWSAADRVNFSINMSMSAPPYFNGDIRLSNDAQYRYKIDKLCGSGLVGPRFMGICWERWNIFFANYGLLGYALDATQLQVPPEDVNNWNWPQIGYFRPWDDTDPYYQRALDMFDAKPEGEKVFSFMIPFREGFSTYYVNVSFAIAQDEEEAPIFSTQYGENQVGTAKLTLKRK